MRFTVKDLKNYINSVNENAHKVYPRLVLRQDSGVYRVYTEDGHRICVGCTAKETHELLAMFLDGIRYRYEREV